MCGRCVQTNAALITQVNAEVLELIENLGALKLMIQLRIPAVESESNFGGQRTMTVTKANNFVSGVCLSAARLTRLTICVCRSVC